jgi:hypothetical protein
LSQIADLCVNDELTFRDCLINPFSDSTLLSEGALALEGWTFYTNADGKHITTPDQREERAYRRGMLYYLPRSLVGRAETNPIFNQELCQSMELEDAVRYFQAMTVSARENKTTGVTPEPAPAPAEAPTPITRPPQATQDPELEAAWRKHAANGHREPMTFNGERLECSTCIQALMVDLPARKGGCLNRVDHLVTVNSDTLDLGEYDNNGHRYGHDSVVLGDSLGDIVLTREKDASTQAKAWSKTKAFFEATADPGGKLGYKVRRRHTDQGTEFQGESAKACSDSNVLETKGLVDRHTDSSVVENRNRMVQRTATALCTHALKSEDLHQALAGEALRHASELINHSKITPMQKTAGITAYEEHSGIIGASADFHEDLPVWGEKVYAYVPMKNRPGGKLGYRAVRAIWVGYDREVTGASRIVPVEWDRDDWLIHPTRVVKKFSLLKGSFPLRGHEDLERRTESDTEAWDIIFNQLGIEGKVAWARNDDLPACEADSDSNSRTYEVEAIVDVKTDKAGRSFKVKWVGYGMDQCDWIAEKEMRRCCGDLVTEFLDSNKELCVVELKPEEYLSDKYLEATRAAVEREKTQMCDVFGRLRPIDSSTLSDRDKKSAHELRHSVTRKRPTPEQLAAGEEGKIKDRIVSKDLKCRNQKPAADTHSDVPPLSAFRLMLAPVNDMESPAARLDHSATP